MVSRSFPAADTERWPACSPLVLQGENPIPSPQEQIEAVGLARCHSSRTKTYTSSLFAGKRYLQTSALPNTGCESSLPSCKEMFQVPGTLWCSCARITSLRLSGGTDKNPPASAGDMASIPNPGRVHMPQVS